MGASGSKAAFPAVETPYGAFDERTRNSADAPGMGPLLYHFTNKGKFTLQ